MEAPNPELVARVAAALRGAGRVLFITGAGVSADSGLPTYRGIGGLYDQADTEEGVPIEAALSGAMMRSNPSLCWKYIHQIEAACRGAGPNGAHHAMAALERRLPHVCVLTQNVDGLHRAAGSRNLIEIHGNVHDLRCTVCRHDYRVPDYADLEIPPDCPECGGLVRPQVVLFGEMLPDGPIEHLYRELEAGFDVVLSVGTTSVFPYIAQPVVLARRRGKVAVEINPGRSEVSEIVTLRLRSGAAATLEAILAALG